MHFKIETISALHTDFSYRKLRLRADRKSGVPVRQPPARCATLFAGLSWHGSLTWLSPCCSIFAWTNAYSEIGPEVAATTFRDFLCERLRRAFTLASPNRTGGRRAVFGWVTHVAAWGKTTWASCRKSEGSTADTAEKTRRDRGPPPEQWKC